MKSPRVINSPEADSDSGEAAKTTPHADATKITGGFTNNKHSSMDRRKSGSFGRRRPRLIGKYQSHGSPTQLDHPHRSTNLLTVIAEKMTDVEIDSVIYEGRRTNTDLHIKDKNGKVLQNHSKKLNGGEKVNVENTLEAETSELELISSLCSNTEVDKDTKEHNLGRSKCLTKTNHLIRLNNPVITWKIVIMLNALENISDIDDSLNDQ